eukprot:g4781.t1
MRSVVGLGASGNAASQAQRLLLVQARTLAALPRRVGGCLRPLCATARFSSLAVAVQPAPAPTQPAPASLQHTAHGNSEQLEPVFMVTDKESAKHALKMLYSLPDGTYHACDTETRDIQVKKQSPVGNGRVTCLCIYCGPEVDFGQGAARLFIDNLGASEGTLDEFKPYLEDPKILKVWHNYSFDKHVLSNHNINCQGFGGDTMHMARLWDAARSTFEGGGGYSLEALSADLLGESKRKISMKERFGAKRILKNGQEGKLDEVPPVEELQSDPAKRRDFVDYASYDAQATWYLRQELEKRLKKEECKWNNCNTLWDFYQRHWKPFGELLTEMEAKGIYIDKSCLQEAEEECIKDQQRFEDEFRAWAVKYCEGARYMNIGSSAQKQHFFFSTEEGEVKEFKTENEEQRLEEGKTKPLKQLTFSLRGMGWVPLAKTPTGLPSVNVNVLRQLAGYPRADPPRYGSVMKNFQSPEEGIKACLALDSLCSVSATRIMLNTFILPLQENCDPSSGRIHFSLNINTETGRLSCRNPNLQNQPALEKDRYKIRRAFAASEGNTLIVADYGQLELRVLAHMAKCKSMRAAFLAGGDFHSRTALGMYPHIREAVQQGKVLLERAPGQPADVPLLKDVYASERRKAKTLNFSIAYGKTKHGLAKDWDMTVEKASEVMNSWYKDRKNVKKWQENTIKNAKDKNNERHVVTTLMGRQRPLPGFDEKSKNGHARRAAVNTPIQGGAADIVMQAMLVLRAHKRFRTLGWQLVLQIHDEIIAEGPEEHVQEAMEIVRTCMENPFDEPLFVPLVVDCKSAKNWYEAK